VTSSYNKRKLKLISEIYFWNKTLQVSDSSSIHHQEFFTVHAVDYKKKNKIYHCAKIIFISLKFRVLNLQTGISKSKFINTNQISIHLFPVMHLYVLQVYVIQVCWQLARRISIELLASCQQTSMTYVIAVCTVKNSWWWTKELSEIC